MRIAIVNSFYPPWRGGAETYVSNLALALRGRGHSVDVICSCDPLKPGISDEDGVQVNRLRLAGRLYGTPIPLGLARALRMVDADVFHANFPSPYFAFKVSRTAKSRKIPAVLTWHNDLPPVTSAAGILINLHDNVVLHRYIRGFSRVISTSPTYALRSRNLSRFADLVTVIPNGVDCERFNPKINSSHLREDLLADQKFVILFVAALTKWHRYKGLDILIRAVKIAVEKVSSVLLVIVGDGELRTEFESLVNASDLKQHVMFVGDVSDDILPCYYAACDVLALPSKDMSEGFGLTLLEANATGKACIASNIGGIPSVIENNHNGILVPPNDTNALAQAIIFLATHPEKCLELGRNGREFALLRDWKQIAALTEQVYMQSTHKS